MGLGTIRHANGRPEISPPSRIATCQRKCRMDIRKKKMNECGACSGQLWEDVSYLYTPAADTYLLPSAEAVVCTARSAGGWQLKYLANKRSHQPRRFQGVSAAIATATPNRWRRAGVNEHTAEKRVAQPDLAECGNGTAVDTTRPSKTSRQASQHVFHVAF